MTTQHLTVQDVITPNSHRTARLYGMACHLGAGIWAAALGWLIVHQFAARQWSFTSIDAVLLAAGLLGTLGLWFSTKRRYPFVNWQYREVLNFQIAIALNSVLWSILSLGYVVVTLLATTDLCGEPEKSAATRFDPVTHPVIGFFTVLTAIRLVQVGIASWKALAGRSHRYPFILRFLR